MSKIPVSKETKHPRPAVKSINLDMLQDAALAHLKSSKISLLILNDLSKSNGFKYDPYKCVKEGSYFLCYADQIVQIYKSYTNGKVYDKNIKKIEATLKSLEFSRKHLTEGYSQDYHNGKISRFVSKGQGAKYYEMLHNSENGVKDFITIAERNINGPVQNFLNDLSDQNAARRILNTFVPDDIKDNSKSVDFAVEAKEDENIAVEEKKPVEKTKIFTNNVVLFFSVLGIVIAETIRMINYYIK